VPLFSLCIDYTHLIYEIKPDPPSHLPSDQALTQLLDPVHLQLDPGIVELGVASMLAGMLAAQLGLVGSVDDVKNSLIGTQD
jgi:hypothetical protein